MRHALASHRSSTRSDHDRPLLPLGRKAAYYIGFCLTKQKIIPDTIISSTALRAKETVESVLDASAVNLQVSFSKELYLADINSLIKQLNQLPQKTNIAMLVGHNPGLGHFLNMTCRDFQSMEPGACAQIQFNIPGWGELKEHTNGKLINYWSPDKRG